MLRNDDQPKILWWKCGRESGGKWLKRSLRAFRLEDETHVLNFVFFFPDTMTCLGISGSLSITKSTTLISHPTWGSWSRGPGVRGPILIYCDSSRGWSGARWVTISHIYDFPRRMSPYITSSPQPYLSVNLLNFPEFTRVGQSPLNSSSLIFDSKSVSLRPPSPKLNSKQPSHFVNSEIRPKKIVEILDWRWKIEVELRDNGGMQSRLTGKEAPLSLFQIKWLPSNSLLPEC